VTADTKLPEWPDAPPIEVYVHNNMSHQLAYQSLRADAAMARLRVAVEALREISHPYWAPGPEAAKALAAIGPLPPLPPLPTLPEMGKP
jgi:hypothetical protein